MRGHLPERPQRRLLPEAPSLGELHVAEITFAVVVIIGLIFISAGVTKIRYGRFAANVGSYGLLPQSLVAPVGLTLPWLETALGAGLLVGVALPWLLTVAIALLLAFALAMSLNLLRGRVIPCGCQGTTTTISWPLVARNLLLAAAAGLALWSGPAPGLRAIGTSGGRLGGGAAFAALLALALGATGLRALASLRALQRQADALPLQLWSGSHR